MTDNTNFIIINSKFRKNKDVSTSANFIYELGEALEVKEIAIKSVSLVNAEYNVKAGHNTLIVNNGAVDSALTFSPGQYDITTLLAELVTQLNATYGGANTAVLDPITKKVKVTTTTPVRFGIDQTTSPMGFIFGFGDEPFSYYPEFAAAAVNAPNLPNLQGNNNYHIVSQTLSQGQGSLLQNNNKLPIIVTVPANVDFGSVINYEVSEINLSKRTFSRPVNIQDIDIRVYDDDNEIVDLGGTPVEIVLQIIKSAVLPFSFQDNRMII